VTKQTYLIALGSNYPHPHARVAAAAAKLGLAPLSYIITSRPIGPSLRSYANAVGILHSHHAPPRVLHMLKQLERKVGRRPGKRWAARPLDLDIIGWSGGMWVSNDLIIPHPRFRERDFVLAPVLMIAPSWRDPVTKLTVRHLRARLKIMRKKREGGDQTHR
jgi:2-amino-4-hydroxy-6-hydroxymethyldihydropteridine diphosphokinase